MGYLRFSSKDLLELFFNGKLNALLNTPSLAIKSITTEYIDYQNMYWLNIDLNDISDSKISLNILEYNLTDIETESIDNIILKSQKFLLQEKESLMNDMLLDPIYYQIIQKVFNDDETLAFDTFLKVFSNLVFQVLKLLRNRL